MIHDLANHLAPAMASATPRQYVAAASTPARLISSRRVGDAVIVHIDDNGVTRLIRVTRADQPELGVLSPSGRAQVQSAVLAMHLAMHGGANEANT